MSRVGKPLVECTTCHRSKKPVGRSAPMEMGASLCDPDCPGYYAEPKPSDLWPGEEEYEAGPICGDRSDTW
jgi:hypothetical protein